MHTLLQDAEGIDKMYAIDRNAVSLLNASMDTGLVINLEGGERLNTK